VVLVYLTESELAAVDVVATKKMHGKKGAVLRESFLAWIEQRPPSWGIK
jgi:hypothetical protein